MSNPIRILQVVTHMNVGGLETMIMNLYRHMDREKVQFDFLVHREERGAYDDEIEALGGRIFRISRLVPWSPFYRHELYMFFASHPEYKIIHVHQDCLSAPILHIAKKAEIPVRIAHSHTSSQDKNLKYPIKLFYKQFISRYATDLFACGEEAGKWMFGKAEFSVLNNAIDTEKYRFDAKRRDEMRRSLGLSESSFAVGHVGRFSYPKNHEFLLDVFTEILKRNDRSVLLLAGDGELREQTEKRVKALQLEDKVRFLGIRSDIPNLLQAMDVFVFPSRYEGLPVSLVEAQSAGLSCFISDRVPDDCKLTSLVKTLPLESSAAEWAEEILKVGSERPDSLDEIRAKGFDITDIAKKMKEFYLEKEQSRS